MDSDHRLLLKNAKPLLQSRNSAVSYPPSYSADFYSISTGCHGYGSVVPLCSTQRRDNRNSQTTYQATAKSQVKIHHLACLVTKLCCV